MKRYLTVNTLLWLVYIALLAVLLPHTAWAFEQFEPAGGRPVAWAAAFAFEAAIAVLTHKLAKHIETTPKRLSARAKFGYRYLNAYAVGLVTALGVSVLANLAHAVQFGRQMAIFGDSPVLAGVYSVAFGAVLPMVSLLFARVLSNVVESEQDADPELVRVRSEMADVRRQLRDSEQQRRLAEQHAAQAEQRFDAAGELFARLFSDEKRQRILAARASWPELPAASIAIIAAASASYVSEVLSADVVEQV